MLGELHVLHPLPSLIRTHGEREAEAESADSKLLKVRAPRRGDENEVEEAEKKRASVRHELNAQKRNATLDHRLDPGLELWVRPDHEPPEREEVGSMCEHDGAQQGRHDACSTGDVKRIVWHSGVKVREEVRRGRDAAKVTDV